MPPTFSLAAAERDLLCQRLHREASGDLTFAGIVDALRRLLPVRFPTEFVCHNVVARALLAAGVATDSTGLISNDQVLAMLGHIGFVRV